MARPIRHRPVAPEGVIGVNDRGGRYLSIGGGRHITEARWRMCELAAFTHYHEDTPVGRALRALSREHRERMPHSLDACVEAMAVLDEFDARGAFEAWKRLEGRGTGGFWPTSDGARFRAALKPPDAA